MLFYKAVSHKIHDIFSSQLFKDSINTTFWGILGKSTGFLIPFFIASWFGISADMDAFFFAYSLIVFFTTIFSPALECIIVPFIAELRKDTADIGFFIGRVLAFTLVILILLGFILLVISKSVLCVFTNFSQVGLDLIFIILLEASPLLVLVVWTSIIAGTLNAYKLFTGPALSPALRATITLFCIYMLKNKLGVHAIALGYVAGEFFRLAVLTIILRMHNLFKIRLSLVWDHLFSRFVKTISYQVIGMCLLALLPVINKSMASWLGSGKVSQLEYADRLYMIPITLLVNGYIVTLLAHWSDQYQSRGEVLLRKSVNNVAKIVFIISISVSILLFITKTLIVSLAYGHGKFPLEMVQDVSTIFGYYLIGITPYSLTQVYIRAFLAKQNSKIMVLLACIILVSTITLNFIYTKYMGVSGIAVSTSNVNYLLCIITMYLFYRSVSGSNRSTVLYS